MGNPRSLLGIGVTTVLVGIAIAATGDPLSGGVVTVTSLVLLIYALHRLGRSGPDAPLDA
ncbi:MAG: hypothetical protein IPI67_16395 [Myxococcales bacterium]|nr:hypothetical protein [Myxococcales bacterium]